MFIIFYLLQFAILKMHYYFIYVYVWMYVTAVWVTANAEEGPGCQGAG